MTIAVERAMLDGDEPAYVGAFAMRGGEIFAAGGAYGRSALLSSTDGGATFTAWSAPRTSGLRDVLLGDDGVWIVGEQGYIGVTADRGASWRRVELWRDLCLHAIARSADGATWIGGERGLVLRAPAGGTFEPVSHPGSEHVFRIALEDDAVWLMGIETFERSTGDRFAHVPIRRDAKSICDMVRLPSGVRVVAGREAALYRSSNGHAWDAVRYPVDEHADFEGFAVTPYGLFLVGPGVFVSHDDGRSFARVELDLEIPEQLYALRFVPGALLVGGRTIYRIRSAELAKLLPAERDPVVAGLVGRVAAGDLDAELVLEDALRERGRY